MIMIKTLSGLFALLALLAGCASVSIGPQAGGPVPAIVGAPGKAVVYIVRTRPDASYLTGTLVVDDQIVGSTHAGTYMRLEFAPGRHRIAGYGQDTGAIALDVQADRLYFVQHSVTGSWRAQSPHSFFTVLTESRGRAAMAGTVNAAG
jgi:hypothetical protein